MTETEIYSHVKALIMRIIDKLELERLRKIMAMTPAEVEAERARRAREGKS